MLRPTGSPAAFADTVPVVRASRVILVFVVAGLIAGCSSSSQPRPSASRSPTSPGPGLTTRVVSVTSTSQLSDNVKWLATNKTSQVQLATCEVLVLNGSTQLGEFGPTRIAVAAGATAEQFSDVTTLAGSEPGDTAQIACQKG